MSNTIARYLVALMFALVVGLLGFARAMPTNMRSGMQAGCCAQGCQGPKLPGKMGHSMPPNCLAVACVGAVSLPTIADPSVNMDVHYVPFKYAPPISVRLVGLDDVPNAPPPKHIILS